MIRPVLPLFPGALLATALLTALLAPTARALSLHPEEPIRKGDKSLVFRFDDSIRPPDLARIAVEGYTLQQAAFLELGDDSAAFRPSPRLLHLPGASGFVLLAFDSTTGRTVLETPASYTAPPGLILADTAFGGLLRKVLAVEEAEPGPSRKRYALRTAAALLGEAFESLDLSVSARADLNRLFADGGDTLTRSFGDTALSLGASHRGAGLFSQPQIRLRLKVREGKVEVFRLEATGDLEVTGRFSARLSGPGRLELEKSLGRGRTVLFPLLPGLFLRLREGASLSIRASSPSEGMGGTVDGRVQHRLRLKAEGGAEGLKLDGEDKPAVGSKLPQDLLGEGEIRFAVKVKLEAELVGGEGVVLDCEQRADLVAKKNGAGERRLSMGGSVNVTVFSGSSPAPGSRFRSLLQRDFPVWGPPEGGTVQVRDLDSNSALLQVQTNPKAEFFQVQIRGEKGEWEMLPERFTGPRFRLPRLKPGMAYTVRLLGQNALGLGEPFPKDGLSFQLPRPNRPPGLPYRPSPAADSRGLDSALRLAWAARDPDSAETLSFDLVLDTVHPPRAVRAEGLSDSALAVSGLEAGRTYYWKVIARDAQGAFREGPVWAFRTAPKPPPAPLAALPGPEGQVRIPAGFFHREDGARVEVAGFFLSAHEVIQADFQQRAGHNPSFRQGDSLPVERVTWDEARRFCEERGGRLPTEAEWEYAARGGQASEGSFRAAGLDEAAWFHRNSGNRTQKVGRKKPNAFGLFDMAGNVAEWVSDWYGDYDPSRNRDPRGPATGSAKVIRGGSWYSEAESLGPSARLSNRPSVRNYKVGFRCAQDARAPAASGGNAASAHAAPSNGGAVAETAREGAALVRVGN